MKEVYVETNEDLSSIIDKIKRSRSDEIILIVPSNTSLKSIVNLRILNTEAASLGKEVFIVTGDSLIRELVQQAGFRILEKSEFEKQTAQTKRTMFDIVAPERVVDLKPKKDEPIVENIEPIETVEEPVEESKPFDRPLDDLGEKEEQFEELFERKQKEEEIIFEPKKPKEPKPSFRIFTKKRIISFIIIIGLVGLGFVFYFVLPSVKVFIAPKKEALRFETEIIADKNVDSVIVADNTIPGQVFQLEMENSKTLPTTGEKDVEEKAKGKITVYNQYSSSPQTLVKTTRFLAEGGKLFRLVETTVIPGATIEEGKILASFKEVEVEADEPGESYNISPSKFTIPGFQGSPKYESFYGESKEPMAGGAKGKMRVATKDDIDGAKELVSLELKNKVAEQFDKKIPSDLKILKDSQSLEVIESSSNLEPDQPGKEFTVFVKVRAWGLAFKEQDIIYLIEKNIVDKISENKVLLPSTIKVDYKSTETDSANGKATFSCQIEADAAWKLNEDEIKNNLAGKNEIDVRKYLSSLTEIETARVVFWPFWVKKIPVDKGKIKIIIQAK